MKANEKIEMRIAFEWTCPECGTDHFHRGITPKLNIEDRQEVRDELGIQEWEEGVLMCRPDTVTCPGCKHEFDVLEPEPDEEFGDPDEEDDAA